MTEPTKGPYRAHPAENRRKELWRALVTDERLIAIGCGYGLTREEAEANAQLFAAAWEMREALEKLARLGNGNLYGNSEGNVIAQRALEVADGSRRQHGGSPKDLMEMGEEV
jgi:hypothetical protein